VEKKIKVLTIPLFPFCKPGRKKPIRLKRIRPFDSLNLKKMIKEIHKSSIITFDIRNKTWSVVSVYSAYSPDVHVMLVETSPDRCLPGPEKIPDKEGNKLMRICSAILEFIAQRKINNSIHFGYNWSPRSWGKEEEKTGFQSIPTKWHPHLWGWPDLDNPKSIKQKYIKSVELISLPFPQQRLLGNNNYAKPFGLLIRSYINKTFHENSLLFEFFPRKKWQIDGRGIYAVSNLSLISILNQEEFFSSCLKPLASMLEQLSTDLTEIFTKMNCAEADRLLLKTEKQLPKNWRKLRVTPVMNSPDYIISHFVKRGYPLSLFNAIYEPIYNRCNEQGNPENWWRKGFGYCLVLSGDSEGFSSRIRIMPAVFTGPGGIVEAQGVILNRPENKRFSKNKTRQKCKTLWELAEYLKNKDFSDFVNLR